MVPSGGAAVSRFAGRSCDSFTCRSRGDDITEAHLDFETAGSVSAYRARVNAEGWYRDPYGLHTDRWISDGQPSDLVRDDGVVSHDAPPSDATPGPLVESNEAPPREDDLLRADADEGPFSGADGAQAVLDGGIIGPEF